MKRLNIFVDESGDFGFSKGSSELYCVSFVFHEHDNDIIYEIDKLNQRLNKIGYTNMIHTANLIMNHDEYSNFSIKTRKDIFNAIYHFSRIIPVRYKSIILDKKYINNHSILRNKLLSEINAMVSEHEKYFRKFDKIVLYYDNGQESLGNILDSIFLKFSGLEHRVSFDHKEKRVFQVSDMLTYIDKYDYKYKRNKYFTKSEKRFFTDDEIKRVLKALSSKRL